MFALLGIFTFSLRTVECALWCNANCDMQRWCVKLSPLCCCLYQFSHLIHGFLFVSSQAKQNKAYRCLISFSLFKWTLFTFLSQ